MEDRDIEAGIRAEKALRELGEQAKVAYRGLQDVATAIEQMPKDPSNEGATDE